MRLLPVLFAACLCLPFASAQSPAPDSTAAPATPMPKNPRALWTLIAGRNGLRGDDLKPWHLSATFETFDRDGNSEGTGSFEEWWASPQKWKRTWTRGTFTRTEYGIAEGYTSSGSEEPYPFPAKTVLLETVEPVPSPELADKFKFKESELQSGPLGLKCLMPENPRLTSNLPPGTLPTYCFEKDRPVVRTILEYGSDQTLFNRIAVLQDRYIPQDTSLFRNRKPLAKVSVTRLENLPSAPDELFTPPADAPGLTPTVTLSHAVMAGRRIGGKAPQYPPDAKLKHIQGTVVMTAQISPEGRIVHLVVMSGPPALQDSALQAVRTWTYKPYLLNGVPVKVDTQINVVFALGG
jgi:TonB family protein